MSRLIVLFALTLLTVATDAQAAKRIALLIGNQDYRINSLNLKNPHNDVNSIGRALTKVGFKVRIVKDAGLGKLHRELNRYTKSLKRAGKDAIGFFYYSGHGALNDSNRFNYIIPADVETVDTADLWDGSIRLKRIVDDLKDKAGNAIHFVVFDACRNELKLAQKGSRSLVQPKGFKPIRESVRGMLIAYATAEGEIASDLGDGIGPYAEALSKAIVKPGLEAVNMFREVQVAVFNNIGQEPWYTHGALRRVYFAGERVPTKPQAPVSPAARDWQFVKDTNNPTALRAFARRYTDTVFADMALAIAATLDQRTVASNAPSKPAIGGAARCADGFRINAFQSVGLVRGLVSRCVRAGRSFQDCEACPEMVVVPAGSFMMGSNNGADDEKPVRKVTIAQPFAVGKFEVTFAEWDACVADGGCKHKPGDRGWGRSKRPVMNVSWDDISKQYLPWLSKKSGKNYRLLSEAEWEYVARAGTTTAYWWGDKASHEYANYGKDDCCDGLAKGSDKWVNTAPVGSFKANAFGLHDLHGNVREWTEDCWNGSNKGNPGNGAARRTGDCGRRVLRGGSWGDYPRSLRSADRYWISPVARYDSFGFRVGRTLTP
jgi:formylglycine-generating enzyme required for sulfatase activity